MFQKVALARTTVEDGGDSDSGCRKGNASDNLTRLRFPSADSACAVGRRFRWSLGVGRELYKKQTLLESRLIQIKSKAWSNPRIRTEDENKVSRL